MPSELLQVSSSTRIRISDHHTSKSAYAPCRFSFSSAAWRRQSLSLCSCPQARPSPSCESTTPSRLHITVHYSLLKNAMPTLTTLPKEIFDSSIEHVSIASGIQEAVLSSTLNHAFDAAILRAICGSQVVSITDPATDMKPSLKEISLQYSNGLSRLPAEATCGLLRPSTTL